MHYDDHLRKQLRASCPPGATGVVLVGDIEGRSSRRYPAEGFFPFWTEFDLDVPNGLYLVTYYEGKTGAQLKTATLKHLRVERAVDPSRHVPGSDAAAALGVPIDSSRTLIFPEHQRELSAVESNLRAATAEFTKHKMAVAMQHDALGLARKARHTRELQESAALNTTYRLEMQAMAETHSNITRRHVEHSAKMIEVLGLTSEMVGGVVSNLQKAAGSIAQPPPPPVDYSDAIVKGINSLGGLVLQVVHAVKGPPRYEPINDRRGPPPEDSVEAGVGDEGATASHTGAKGPRPDDRAAPVAAANPHAVKPEPEYQRPKAARSGMEQAGSELSKQPNQPLKRPAAPICADPAPKGTPKTEPKLVEPQLAARELAREAGRPQEAPASSKDPALANELDRLAAELAEGTGDCEQALPTSEPETANTAVAFFLAPENDSEHNRWKAYLKKVRDRGELEQLIALDAPHLLNTDG